VDDLCLTEIQANPQGDSVSRETDTQQIVAAVEAAERRTSAEFVVALEPRCGSYRDIDSLFASAITFLSLLYTVFDPRTTHPAEWLPLNLAIIFGLAWVFSAHTPFIRRLLTGCSRKKRQVEEAAQLLFHKQGVSQTRGRTGVVVLISQTERCVAVIADSGVRRAVGKEQWEELLQSFQPLAHGNDLAGAAATVIEQLGEFLAEPLPVADDDIDELSNLPHLH
jgi:putative membrane protein